MKELVSKKSNPRKRGIGENEVQIIKRSYNCDCGCFGAASEHPDYNGGFDLAFDDPAPACGCGCGSQTMSNQVCDMAYED